MIPSDVFRAYSEVTVERASTPAGPLSICLLCRLHEHRTGPIIAWTPNPNRQPLWVTACWLHTSNRQIRNCTVAGRKAEQLAGVTVIPWIVFWLRGPCLSSQHNHKFRKSPHSLHTNISPTSRQVHIQRLKEWRHLHIDCLGYILNRVDSCTPAINWGCPMLTSTSTLCI